MLLCTLDGGPMSPQYAQAMPRVDRRGAQAEGCRRSLTACTAAECRAAPVLWEVDRERGMRVCFFGKSPQDEIYPVQGT